MSDKKLTDNEITKALKCVPKDVSGYIIDENNKMKLVHNEDVLDLINRQQAELKVSNEALNNSIKLNNRLETQNKDLAETIHNLTIEKDALFDKAEELKAKVEKLNKEIQITKDAYTMLQTKIEIIKSEAVKEFMEKLKENISDDCRIVSDEGEYVGYDCDDVMYCINNLVKEFERKGNTTYDNQRNAR